MKSRFTLPILMAAAVFAMTTTVLVLPRAFACSAFRMPAGDQVIVGRNFDWDFSHGLMVINKRGVSKRAFGLHPSDTATWTSKYGSLTFNQAGRELPYGGLNEKGLMIEVLWLGWTAWPVTAAPSINEIQWIQYQLDQRDSVRDLISHLDDVRILSVFAKVHFFACDASGECATIEGLGDHVEVHSGKEMPIAALTNDSFENSVKYASPYLRNGACSSIPSTSTKSLDRFARAACSSTVVVSGESLEAEIDRTNRILNSVAQGDYTKWQIVYNLTSKTISIRTQHAPQAKTVSLSAFDFSCGSPVQIMDLNAVIGAPADVSSSFVDYSDAANRSIVERSLLNGFAHLPQTTVDKIVDFPKTTACLAP